jgi:hypothetical protein
MACLEVMAECYTKKLYKEIAGYYSPKETNRTRHIARRFYYVRHCVGNGKVPLFKVKGTNNPANCLMKPLSAQQLQLKANICFNSKLILEPTRPTVVARRSVQQARLD